METLLFLLTLFITILLGGLDLGLVVGSIFILIFTIKEVISYVTNR